MKSKYKKAQNDKLNVTNRKAFLYYALFVGIELSADFMLLVYEYLKKDMAIKISDKLKKSIDKLKENFKKAYRHEKDKKEET